MCQFLIRVFRYVIHQYIMQGNEVATRPIRGKRLAFLQSMMKSRELYTEIMPDILKLQKIGDPNDNMVRIPSAAEFRLNTQQMIVATQKIYEVIKIAYFDIKNVGIK